MSRFINEQLKTISDLFRFKIVEKELNFEFDSRKKYVFLFAYFQSILKIIISLFHIFRLEK